MRWWWWDERDDDDERDDGDGDEMRDDDEMMMMSVWIPQMMRMRMMRNEIQGNKCIDIFSFGRVGIVWNAFFLRKKLKIYISINKIDMNEKFIINGYYTSCLLIFMVEKFKTNLIPEWST